MAATLSVDWSLIVAVMFGLAMFGLAYNTLVDSLGERKEGYVSLLVAGGVIVTLLGVAMIDWRAAGLALAAFVASGLPMILGDIMRTVGRREKAKRLIRLIANAQAEDIERGGNGEA